VTNKDNYKNNITIPAALSLELSGKVSRLAWALGNVQAGAQAEKRIESRERRKESRIERREESKQANKQERRTGIKKW
jgi:hypothetical protein